MIADPPSPPAVHDTAAWESPALPTTDTGASGTVYGVTDVDTADAAPVPAALVADTLNTYPVPLVNPVTVWATSADAVSATAVVHDFPSSDEYSTL